MLRYIFHLRIQTLNLDKYYRIQTNDIHIRLSHSIIKTTLSKTHGVEGPQSAKFSINTEN